jgi:hypothetical protein
MLLADLAFSCSSNASIGVVEMGLSAQEADLIAAARGLHSEDRARLIRAARAIGAKRATSAEDLTDVGLRAL